VIGTAARPAVRWLRIARFGSKPTRRWRHSDSGESPNRDPASRHRTVRSRKSSPRL